MLSSLFDPMSPGWRMFARVMDLFGLSLCWLLCSIPLFTLGASTTALYDAVFHGVRRGEAGPYARFFSTFRAEFKTATLVTLPVILLYLLYRVLFQVTYVMAVGGDRMAGVLICAYSILFCIPLGLWAMAMATLSRFTFRPAALVKTTVQLAFAHLPSAIAVTVILVFACRLMTWWYFSATFMPALALLAASLFLERVFAPFLAEEAGED